MEKNSFLNYSLILGGLLALNSSCLSTKSSYLTAEKNPYQTESQYESTIHRRPIRAQVIKEDLFYDEQNLYRLTCEMSGGDLFSLLVVDDSKMSVKSLDSLISEKTKISVPNWPNFTSYDPRADFSQQTINKYFTRVIGASEIHIKNN